MKPPAPMNRKGFVILTVVFLVTAALLFAAIPQSDPTKPHAPMEFLGVGPEMFADRGKAWVEALAVVLETMVAKIGVLILAVLALRKTIVSNAEVKERLDRQGERIDQVALAVPPVATSTVKIEQPPDKPIPVKEAATI